jgi:hypothetical protein
MDFLATVARRRGVESPAMQGTAGFGRVELMNSAQGRLSPYFLTRLQSLPDSGLKA